MKTAVLTGLLCLTPLCWADSSSHPAPEIPAAFKAMQQVLGDWQGTQLMDGKEVPVTVSYELTSGGTAMTERLMAGTPEEMVSVYHMDGDSVAMTHYCALGNQPYMKLTRQQGNSFAFEMAGNMGVQSAAEPHMHGVTLILKDANTLQQRWSHYADGKLHSEVTFDFQRQR